MKGLARLDRTPLFSADVPTLDQRKFKDDALNDYSPDPNARSKAEVCRRTLGYTAEKPELLEAQKPHDGRLRS